MTHIFPSKSEKRPTIGELRDGEVVQGHSGQLYLVGEDCGGGQRYMISLGCGIVTKWQVTHDIFKPRPDVVLTTLENCKDQTATLANTRQ